MYFTTLFNLARGIPPDQAPAPGSPAGAAEEGRQPIQVKIDGTQLALNRMKHCISLTSFWMTSSIKPLVFVTLSRQGT